MASETTEQDKWQKRYMREKSARQQAEKLLEEKSSQLYLANQKLEKQVLSESLKFKREEEKFTTLFHYSNDGIILQDDTGLIIDANKTICDILGLPREKIVGSSSLKIPTRKSFPLCIQALREIIDTGSARFQCHLSDLNKNSIPVDISATRFHFGEEMVIQGVIRDMSAQHKAAENLKDATQAAINANNAKSLFLATMSHEIRTPLNAVLGFTDLLLDSSMSEEQNGYLKVIRKSGDLLLNIIDDILDFSRIESGHLVLDNTIFNIRDCVNDILHLHAQKAASKGVELSCEIQPETPETMYSDSARLKQILINLVSNSLKFTSEGSIKVKIQMRNENFIQFSVLDTGIGIEADVQDILFQPFRQADTSITRKYAGSGLGLAICRQLTDLMGGTISVHSQIKAGSEFTVILPTHVTGTHQTSDTYKEQAHLSQATVERNTAKEPARSRPFALLVEDNAINAKLAKLLIERLGIIVHVAVNGKEALTTLEEKPIYGIVFMDMQMPEMDGVSATKAIRKKASSYYQDLPIISMTANILPEDEAKCIAAGMDGYISKPISIDHLKQVLVEHHIL